MAINDTATRRNFDRRFFLTVAILFPLVVLIGFGPTYYLKPLFVSPPVPRLLVHLHSVAMSAWIILFFSQVYLIRSSRIKLHQRMGIASVVLAVAVFILGLLTAVAAAKYGSNSTPPGADPLQFLIVPFFDMFVFAVLFGAALYYRRNAPNHKRLMLLTVINFLPPALARFPLGLTATFGPLWFFGVPDLVAIGLVIADTWKHGKLNKAFLGGALFMIASHWLRLPISTSNAWISFATWLTSFGI